MPLRPALASSYRSCVPAVARAVQALEHLAGAQQPVALSVLSRALNVGPSSLLAILTTLCGAGLVQRSPRDGRYQLGSGLVTLGAAAAAHIEPLRTFDLLATDLVDQLGETVLLWIQQGDGLALAAVRDGTRPLRYVPPLGLGLPVSGWASRAQSGVTEGELEPGVWMTGASLDERALLAVVGPAERLRGAAGADARRTLRGLAGGEGVWPGSGPIEPNELDAFLSQPLVASLSYLSDDGYPASVPLWYDWDGPAETFWLVPSPAAEWAEHVRRNPRVSLSISESTPPLRRVLARGPMLAAQESDVVQWHTIEGRLAARYARLDAATVLEGRRGQSRTLLRLVPEHLIAWRGLLRPASSQSPPALRAARRA